MAGDGSGGGGAMPKTHKVKQGEHLSGIALAEGFPNYKSVWEHGDNAALAAVRDPHVLFPTDEVVIPDFEAKVVDKPTDETHPFQIELIPLFLKLRLMDLDNDPVVDAPCTVSTSVTGEPAELVTDKDGKVETEISAETKRAEAVADQPEPPAAKPGKPKSFDPDPIKYDLRIGHLNPPKKMSGQQARLNNLGYFAGYSLRDLDQFLWATEEFELEHVNKSQKAVAARPKFTAPPPEGEDNDTTDDPERETGMESKLAAALETAHGI